MQMFGKYMYVVIIRLESLEHKYHKHSTYTLSSYISVDTYIPLHGHLSSCHIVELLQE